MSYIRNLDGLRALAIGAVLVFHLSESHLPGGFVGVDVFFVISGFIITRGLRENEGHIVLVDFYVRRMARLLPAAMTTIIATLLASTALLAPVDQAHVAATALAALLFVSNVFFTFHAGYFDDVLAGNPLLHFWSLSVEEQFYLVWPLLIIGLARLAPARARRWIAGLTVGSIVASWWFASHDPVLSFYAMPMRAFQFLLGACLVYFEARPVSRLLEDGIFAIGTASVLFAFFAVTGDDYAFGTAALLPALGTMLMIHAIDGRLAGWILGTAPVRGLGRAAYSIYLVHWPVIVFYRIRFGAIDSPAELIALAVASVVGGIALRLAVESPLRLRRGDPRTSSKLATVAVLVVATAFIGGFVLLEHGGDRAPAPAGFAKGAAETDRADAAASPAPFEYDLNALARERRRTRAFVDRCQLFEGAPLAALDVERCLDGDVLLIGDSWMPDTLVALEEAIDASRIAKLGGAACGQVLPGTARRGQRGCHDLVLRRRRAMDDERYRAIVLAVNWRGWRERDLRPSFEALRATGKTIVIMSDRPYFEAKVATLLGALPPGRSPSLVDLTPHLEPKAQRAAAALRHLMTDYDDFVFVDQRRVLCPAGCPALTPEGSLLYLDRSHLTVAGARYVGRALRGELRRALE